MAGERTRDLSKIAVTISAESSGKRTLTALFDWDAGESPERATKREPDLKGNTHIFKKADKSGNPSVTVKVGSQDEKFLDKLAESTESFNLVVIDESNKMYSKQYNGTECYLDKRPADPYRDGDNRTYTILASTFTTKAI